jgi:amino acid adenylation domain-containing protein
MKIKENNNFTTSGDPVDYDPFEPGDQVDYDPFALELEAVVPATAMQMEIWPSTQMGEDASSAFNESCKLYFKGPLDSRAMHAAIQDVVQRHQALRATFSSNGEQMCIAKTIVIDLPEDQLPDDYRFEEAMKQAVATEVSIPFDLHHGPLLRVRLLHKNNQEHYLLLTAHHIVCDGWSLEVIVNDLEKYYSARVNGQMCQHDPPPQYGEYAIASRSESEQEEQRKAREYWLKVLSGKIPNLDLPLDKPRPAHRSFSSARVNHTLPPHLVKRLQRFGADRHASLFIVLLTAFQVLLYRLTGQTDIITGVPYAGHLQPGLTHLVGHCVNLLPIRGRLNGTDSFTDLLEQLRQSMFAAHEHNKCSFGSLIPELNITRQVNRIPLVSVLFGFYKMDERVAQNFQDLQSNFSVNPRTSENFELFVSTVEIHGEVVFETQYNTDLFAEETIIRWLNMLETLLVSALEHPVESIETLPLLDKQTRQQLLYDWNATQMPYRQDACLHQLFVERAREFPEAVVAADEGRGITYAELDAQSDRLAAYLLAGGIKAGDFVGICMQRSIDMLIGVLGILKSGAAYLPLDPSYPLDRLKFMIEDASVKLIVTEKSLKEEFLAELIPSDALICFDELENVLQQQDCNDVKTVKSDPEHLAYVIYTSGSTGKPKGVQVPHRAVVNFLASMAQNPGITKEDVLLAVTTLSFDIAVLELYLPLFVGAKTVIASQDTVVDGKRLLRAVEQYGVTMMQATPATWRLMLAENWAPDARKIKILCGGEPFPKDLLKEVMARASSVWNMYGPTETTVWSTCCRIDDAEAPIHIGKPIGNTQTYILTDGMELAPIGIKGELYIGGDGVTHGYLNRPELTAENFVQNPFNPADPRPIYATGDLAIMRSDGNIECLGRRDNQIKLRGFRIELGEIESCLVTHPHILQSVAVVKEDSPEDKRLIAFFVPEEGYLITSTDLRKYLRGLLPNYMTPQLFVELDEIPLTDNGKINRKALLAQTSPLEASADEFIAPSTAAEKYLADIWSEVLRVPQVSTFDNFIELGGHSLLAMRVIVRVEEETGYRCNFRDMIQDTLLQVAARLPIDDEEKQAANNSGSAIVDRAAAEAPVKPFLKRVFAKFGDGSSKS